MHAMETARTRREEYAEATYEALLDSAAACFMESGFAATSLDAVAKRARVTKGAIYHHFASKRELFMAVLERQEEISARTVTQAATAAADPWTAIVAAFDAFLETISDPVYQRLCWVEGPAALGFEEWWACGERYEIEVIRSQLDRAAAGGRPGGRGPRHAGPRALRGRDGRRPGHGPLGRPRRGAGPLPHRDAPGHGRNGADGGFQATIGRRSR